MSKPTTRRARGYSEFDHNYHGHWIKQYPMLEKELIPAGRRGPDN